MRTKKPQPAQIPSLYHDATDIPCPRCLKLAIEGELRMEAVMPLPQCPPRRRDDNTPCCRDCAAADGLMAMGGHPTFAGSRVCVANDRQEQFRLPGAPLGLAADYRIQRCAPGDLDKHLQWQRRCVEPRMREEGHDV